jgi:hypothetical protein
MTAADAETERSERQSLAGLLPAAVGAALRRARRLALVVAYAGRGRWCPVCERSSRRFQPHGLVRRPDARCVRCGAIERHRLVWLFFHRRTDLFDGRAKAMLHVAPESCFQERLRSRVGHGYLSADLSSPRAMVKMDVTAIQYPDDSFDVVYCSHVLEHVGDDRRAMAELRRVLKPDGWAVLLVPIIAAVTVEDPTVTDPEERVRRFGQHDHVRAYGPDYVDRLREAGFDVEVTRAEDLLSSAERVRMGLTAVDEIYFCTKRSTGGSGGPAARQGPP